MFTIVIENWLLKGFVLGPYYKGLIMKLTDYGLWAICSIRGRQGRSSMVNPYTFSYYDLKPIKVVKAHTPQTFFEKVKAEYEALYLDDWFINFEISFIFNGLYIAGTGVSPVAPDNIRNQESFYNLITSEISFWGTGEASSKNSSLIEKFFNTESEE